MAKKMLIDATHAEETRVVVVDGNKVEEFDFESHAKRQLTGNIYLAKVTRVEPSLQAAFVEYGGNRHGFLAFSEIHPDYYQIPKEDRDALLAEEAALAREEDENGRAKSEGRGRQRKAARREDATDAVTAGPAGTEGEAASAGEEALEDVPPPSAAAGEIEIDVPEEPEEPGEAAPAAAEEGGEAAAAGGDEADDEAYEQVGGDDVEEERRPQRPRPLRRYKIQEVIKVRQILLVQVVKEERGNKGAALTTYLSLAGRYCVLMPNTARGGGISRKITNAADRKKLKDIAASLPVPEGAGLIIRTAGANRTKTEIKRDYEYLLRQWEQLRDLTLRSIAPCLIYEEGSLIKRAIRDLYSRDIDEVLVDGERGYREAKDYMKMLMPSHAKNVKHYVDPLPLFSRYQVESYLAAMFNPVVQLKSGGYIVIDVTEALVAIDVNSGRATREASVEETALKTNLEAAEEAARQMRLRDLAGLIVIDFIDMDERKNNAAVEKRLKEKLKSDRARIQVGRISPFGLLEMSRQRLRPGMIEATTKACPHCHGTGRVRSDDSMALALLRELEEEGVRQRSKEVLIVAPVEIANYLLNQKREHIALIESRFGLSVRVEGDPSLISPDYRVERFKTASRIINLPEPALPAVAMPVIDEDEEEETAAEVAGEEAGAAGGASAEQGRARSGGKRRRRRRRRGGRGGAEAETAAPAVAEGGEEPGVPAEAATSAEPAPTGTADSAPSGEAEGGEGGEAAAGGGSRRRGRGRSRTIRREPALSGQPEAEEAAAAPDSGAGRPDGAAAGEDRPEAGGAGAEAEDVPDVAPEEAAAGGAARAGANGAEAAGRDRGDTGSAGSDRGDTAVAESDTGDTTGAADSGRGDTGAPETSAATAAPARPRRERVRKPAVAVLATVPLAATASPVGEASEVAGGGPSPGASPVPEAPAEAAAPEDPPAVFAGGDVGGHGSSDEAAGAGSAEGARAGVPAAAAAEAAGASGGEPRPRRRGWWSRALGGS
jgi:ribonuclease E